MRVRTLLILTALVSSILGAVVVYLVLSVPNDLRADALLREARGHIASGRTAEAHDRLAEVIQQYPRTDASAAATVALVKLEQQQREQIQKDIEALRKQDGDQTKAITEIQKAIQTIHTNAAAAKSLTVEAPAKKASTAKKTPAKKPTAKRRKR